tara:strand:+ start:2404 stop:2883 length:480 start_codon:yes stop_codon:yes gene_type:complete
MISAQIRSISPALSAPLQDKGIRFFFTHYVSSSPKLQNGEVDCTKSSPQWSLLSIDPSFNNAVSSVGFAGLSNVTKDPEHTIAARKKYAASLRDITLALQDTSKSDLDATFKSVMLLAAFEVRSLVCLLGLSDLSRLLMALLNRMEDLGPYISMAQLPF